MGTMTAQDVARQIAAHHRGRRPFELLAAERIGDMAFAYAVQDLLVEARTADGWGEIVGWKIGMTTAAMQARTGVSEPCAGAVLARGRRASGSVLVKDELMHLGLEGEIAVLVGEGFPETEPVDTAKVWSRIDSVAAGLEITDDRNADWSRLEAASLVADNIWNIGMVIGTPTPARALGGLTGRKGVLSIDGQVYEEGVSDDVGCDPLELVGWLGAHLARRGRPLRPGQWIMTGSFVSTTFPPAGAHYTFAVDGLAPVEATVG